MEVVPWSWNFEWNFGNKTGGWVGHGGGFWEISAVFDKYVFADGHRRANGPLREWHISGLPTNSSAV